MFEKRNVDKSLILTIACSVLSTLMLIFAVIIGVYFSMKSSGSLDVIPYLLKYKNILTLYDNNYVDDFDIENAFDYSIAGLVVSTGDKYGYYLPSKERAIQGSLIIEGNYKGLGVTLKFDGESVIEIVAVIENSPAGRAGLLIGDKITKINGADITAENYQDLLQSINISAIDGVLFEINNNQEIYIELGEVITEKVSTKVIDDIGYITVYTFVDDTVDLFKEAIDLVVDSNVSKVVFDLRDNRGGSADAVIEMLNYIIADDMIADMNYVHSQNKIYYADSFSKLPKDIEIFIVVNQNTASASELFTMTLQDVKGAKVIGQNTYGKSTILSLFLLDDDSILCMSVGTYYSKSYRNIEGVGILPDILLNDSEILLNIDEIIMNGKDF